MAASFRSVGFSGSRRLRGRPAARCRSVAASVASAGLSVLVGCARGADAAALAGAPSAQVFRARGRSPRALVARSVSFVRALAASPAPLLVSFPGCPCPAGLAPAARWVSCGSGSWSSAALAVGLGVPLVVFLPAGALPPSGWGAWSFVSSGLFAGGWLLQPPQLSLF